MAEAVSIRQMLMLQTWTSSAFPIGAFSYSHGLEATIQQGQVYDQESCRDWIHAIISQGSAWNDSIILCHAYRLSLALAQDDSSIGVNLDREPENCRSPYHELIALNELALALQAGAERFKESTQLGSAFLAAASVWQEPGHAPGFDDLQEIAFPVICGRLGALHGLPMPLLLASILQSTASNLTWIAARLVPLGQTSCLQLIASLESVIEAVSHRACECSLDDLGSCTLLADLASLQHEQLAGRVCQT